MPLLRGATQRVLVRWYSSNPPNVVSYVRSTAEQLTGQSDVSAAQARVRERREELKTWRQSVADATARYEEVQHKLRHVYAMKTQLYQAQRRDLAALQTINTEEEELLSEEQSFVESLESTKQKERECFEALGDAIIDSHEKERAQSERMKYYSRLGSILGAALGFLGSNLFLRREVRTHHRVQNEKMECVEEALKGLNNADHAKAMEARLETSDDRVGQLMAVTERQLKMMEDTRRELLVDEDARRTLLVTGVGIGLLSYVICMGTYFSIISVFSQ